MWSKTRALLVCVLLCLSSPRLQAAVTLVQSDCVSGDIFASTNTYVYTFPGALTTGNLVTIGFTSGVPRTISSMAGAATTWALSGTGTSWAGGTVYQTKAVAAGADTNVTITLSGTENNATTLCFAEFTGTAADQSGATVNGAAQGPATAFASGSVTPPTAANVVVVIASHTGGSYIYDSTFTQIDAAGSGNTGYMGYVIQAAATAQESNITSDPDNEFMGQRITAFAGTGAAASTCHMALLGVGCD